MKRRDLEQDFGIPYDEWENLIDKWIYGKNGERNRAIIKDAYLFGLMRKELADKYHLEVRQISNILAKGYKTLSKHI